MERRFIRLAGSIIRQVDGIMVALYGRHARIDRDVCGSSDDSCTAQFGLQPWDCVGSILGLYLHDVHHMPGIVASVASNRGCGVFLVPVRPNASPKIRPEDAKGDQEDLPWFEFLLRHTVLTFNIPRSSVTHSRWQGGFLIVVAQFGRNGRVKAGSNPRRAEHKFKLVSEGPMPFVLPVHPELIPRASPLAASKYPTREKDTAEAAAPFAAPNDVVVPSPNPTLWNVARMRELSTGFPYPDVRNIAIGIMEGTYNPFVGDPQKAVVWPARHQLSAARTAAVLGALDKAVAKGLAWGPLPYCPFPFARPYPPDVVPKSKYDPECAEVRLTSDMSAGGAQSVNALEENPRLLSTHFSVTSFVNIARSLGRGCRVSQGDVKAAFRMNPVCPASMPLMVTYVETGEGPVFYGDRSHNFGHVRSEFGWQTQISLVEWLLRREGIPFIFLYVDNDWQFHPVGTDMEARIATTDAFLAGLGLDRHEKEQGFKGKVLGWLYDLDFRGPEGPMVLILPDLKHAFIRDELIRVASPRTISLKDAEWCAGVFAWLSDGVPGGAAYVSPFFATKAKLECARRLRNVPKSQVSVSKSPQLVECIEFWQRFLTSDVKVVPMVAGFGPFSPAGVRGWTDASGIKGAERVGGVFYNPSTKTLLGFTRPVSANDLSQATGVASVVSACLEVMAIRVWLLMFGARCVRKSLLIEIDCEPAMLAMGKAFSPSPGMRNAVRAAYAICVRHFTRLRVRAIPRCVATIVMVDLLSRNDVQGAKCIARKVFGVELLLV